jgi:D-glycerate 3-kinase
MLENELRQTIENEIQQRALPDSFMAQVENAYLPVAEAIAERQKRSGGKLIVSFNGAQGSGKSTITAFLKILLFKQFGLRTIEISIDDFYLTHAERQKLAQDVHPLLATRGVPGTHDVGLAAKTLDCLAQSQVSICKVPRFDKSIDDRFEESSWTMVEDSVDIILFEGWCNHAPVQPDYDLERPINALERDEDSDGAWRGYANQQLGRYHDELFDRADLLVYLQVPSFEKVFEWRGLQEKKLQQSSGKAKGVMNQAQLERFIQHYERITRSCLEQLPERADIVLKLNDNHAIEAVDIKNPGDKRG